MHMLTPWTCCANLTLIKPSCLSTSCSSDIVEWRRPQTGMLIEWCLYSSQTDSFKFHSHQRFFESDVFLIENHANTNTALAVLTHLQYIQERPQSPIKHPCRGTQVTDSQWSTALPSAADRPYGCAAPLTWTKELRMERAQGPAARLPCCHTLSHAVTMRRQIKSLEITWYSRMIWSKLISVRVGLHPPSVSFPMHKWYLVHPTGPVSAEAFSPRQDWGNIYNVYVISFLYHRL